MPTWTVTSTQGQSTSHAHAGDPHAAEECDRSWIRQDENMSRNEIACPTCGSTELTSGLIVGRSPGVKVKERRGVLGDLAGIPLTTGLFNHSAPAFRCAACRTVVIQPER